MAAITNFYLFNSKVNPPQNWQEMTLEINYDKDKSTNKARVSITDWDFVRENVQLINKHIFDGSTTGVGVFEGIPFKIEIEREGVTEIIFDGYLDLTKSISLCERPIKSNVKAVELYSVDWLNDIADSFTFDYLYTEVGSITKADFIKVPYIISSVPNYTNACVAVVGVYVMVKEIKDAIQRIIEFVAELPIYYVFSTYIKLILYIIYLILLIIALIKLVRDVILLLIQPVKYHSGMRIRTMLEKGCEHLGLTLFSPDFGNGGTYENTVILPAKYYVPENKKDGRILGLTDPKIDQDGFYKGTFGQLIRDCEALINGKIIMQGTTLMLVRDDYALTGDNYELNPPENNYFTLNADEFESNTYITFQTDLSDSNTVHFYSGTAYQVLTQPIRSNYTNMQLMKGLNEVRLPFALGKIKTKLTVPESIMDGFLKIFQKIVGALVKAVNAVIKVLNVIINLVNNILKKLATIGIKIKFRLPNIPSVNMPDFADTFSNRKGMLLLEHDLFNVQKIIDLDIKDNPKNTKLSAENSEILTAKWIWEKYYYINSFVPTSDRPNANQFYKKNYPLVPFTFPDYLKVKVNNYIFTTLEEKAQIDSLKWNPFKQQAEMNVRFNKLYTNNLKETILEPDGS